MKNRLYLLGKFFQQLWIKAKHQNLDILSGSLAFTTILNLVPLLAIAFFILGQLRYLDQSYQSLEPFILSNLSATAGEKISSAIAKFLSKANFHSVGAAGFAGFLFTALLFVKQCRKCLDMIFNNTKQKQKIKQSLHNIALFAVLPILILGSLFLTSVFLTKLKIVIFRGFFLSMLLNLICLSSIYGLVPTKSVGLRSTVLSALIFSFIFELAKIAYASYAKFSLGQHKIYGSLATVPLFFVWLYVSWYIVLVGAVFAKELAQYYETKKRTENAIF